MKITPRMPRPARVGPARTTPARTTPARVGRVLAAAVGTLALGGMLAAGAGPAAATPRTVTATRAVATTRAGAAPRAAGLKRACPAVPAGRMRCFTLYRPQYAVDRALAAGHSTQPKGWGPGALERAYQLPVSRDSHQTVAVSIAFRTPALAKYLRIYREHYGLPACTEATGCLRIVNQKGHLKPRAPSGLGSGWDLEATLDVSMISAACPHCRILVVEANSDFDVDLGRTDVTAARLGADVISNSYGIRENGQTQTLRKDYLRPGHMVVASSGDSGFDAANFPANLGGVTAVGGTQLKRAPGPRGVTERVWDDHNLFAAATSSCSAYVSKPAWQHDGHCPGRTIADISAVAADIPIFNSFYGGWVTVAGTSVSAPFISGVFGLAGNATSVTPQFLYQHRADFFDVTRGNNVLIGGFAKVCGGDYLCKARKGYDAPTGLGTPDGTAGL